MMVYEHGSGYGRARCTGEGLARHRHNQGYMAVVLSGRYHESGDAGRFDVEPGDVLIHRSFEAHLNLFDTRGAEVLNLPLPIRPPASARLKLHDLDAVARLAERDLAAAALLASSGELWEGARTDWPDLLAADLRCSARFSLDAWARQRGLHPASISRGFRKAFGTSPVRYRAEARARSAATAALTSSHSLTAIAHETGFADQAHMCRSVRALTGRAPRELRGG